MVPHTPQNMQVLFTIALVFHAIVELVVAFRLEFIDPRPVNPNRNGVVDFGNARTRPKRSNVPAAIVFIAAFSHR